MKRPLAIAAVWAGIVWAGIVCLVGVGVYAAGWLAAERTIRRLGVALTFVLLASCVHRQSPLERDAFAAAERGWVEAGLGNPGDALKGARIEVADNAADFLRQCRRPMEVAAACWLGWTSKTALMSPDLDVAEYGRAAIHEGLHELVARHLGRIYADRYDRGHTDPRVWQAGGPGSAEARAKEAYDE